MPVAPMTGSRLQVGRISAAHGIKGWVKVYSYTDPIAGILDYAPWYLSKRNVDRTVTVGEGKASGRALVARLEGIDDRDQAELLVGCDIWVDSDRLPSLEAGEYYWHQLEGLVVRNLDGARYGTVDHLIETGANDVLVIRPDADSIDGRERLVPWVEGTIVRDVDLAAGEIRVDWAEDY